MKLPPGIHKTHRVQRYFTNKRIVWNHHSYSSEQHLNRELNKQSTIRIIVLLRDEAKIRQPCWSKKGELGELSYPSVTFLL